MTETHLPYEPLPATKVDHVGDHPASKWKNKSKPQLDSAARHDWSTGSRRDAMAKTSLERYVEGLYRQAGGAVFQSSLLWRVKDDSQVAIVRK